MIGRGRVALGAVVAVALLTSCGAGPAEPTHPSSSTPTPSASASPTEPTQTPTQTPTRSGLTLRQLRFTHGPLDDFTLPSGIEVSARVDQPNVVTIVLANPSPSEVEDYLRATLPAEGFTIDARAAAGQTMTFTGHGWTGAFTGTGPSSAVVLRPH